MFCSEERTKIPTPSFFKCQKINLQILLKYEGFFDLFSNLLKLKSKNSYYKFDKNSFF